MFYDELCVSPTSNTLLSIFLWCYPPYSATASGLCVLATSDMLSKTMIQPHTACPPSSVVCCKRMCTFF